MKTTTPSTSTTPGTTTLWAKGRFVVVSAALLAGVALQFSNSAAAEHAIRLPAPALDPGAEAGAQPETAVFAGGCFWGVQAVFQHTKGVKQVLSGYAGGEKRTADYSLVSTGMTGHAESVQITYDPRQISYGTLLQIFFSVAHDPTQLNRQWPDSGTQYRSAVFYTGAKQKVVAEHYIAQLDAAKLFSKSIVTQVTPLGAFYPAEPYHQDYATLHPESGYIAVYDLPKIANLKALLPLLYRDEPVLVATRGSK